MVQCQHSAIYTASAQYVTALEEWALIPPAIRCATSTAGWVPLWFYSSLCLLCSSSCSLHFPRFWPGLRLLYFQCIYFLMSHKSPFKHILKSCVVKGGCMRGENPDFRHILAGSLGAKVPHPSPDWALCPHSRCGIICLPGQVLLDTCRLNEKLIASVHRVLALYLYCF